MNPLERNSATYYNKIKQIHQEKLQKLKVKKWQSPNYKEEAKRQAEKIEEERKKEEERKRREFEKRGKDALPTKERDINSSKRSTATPIPNATISKESALVLHNPNASQNKLLDPIHQKMLYIQYLLNTFEMYPEFDIHYYRNHNDDIKHLNNYELVYHWNHYGVHQKDTRIYNAESLMVQKPNFYKEYPIYIFMHVCNLHNGIQIFYEQLQSIIDSGLYEKCKNILVCIVGKSFELPLDQYSKLLLLYQDDNPKYYEVKTINYIKYIAERINPESRILYIHTKGVRKNGDEVCVKSWRKLLEYWTVMNHDICLQYLLNYDTVGSNVINMAPTNVESKRYLYYVNPSHFFHYSGNFWWSTAKHIQQLPVLLHDPNKHAVSTRCRAENWILSKLPNMRGFEIYYNKNYVHPYHTYCDPNSYQKKYIEVFTGRNNFEILREESK